MENTGCDHETMTGFENLRNMVNKRINKLESETAPQPLIP